MSTTAARTPDRVSKFLVPEIVFGHGALSEAGFAARRLDARRVFIVTDPGIIAAGWLAELQQHLDDVGLPYVVWHGVTPNPKDHEVATGHLRYQASGTDVIIGLGGGSVIDAAKAVAVLSSNGGQILDYEGVDRVTQAIPPLIMIPSTSGTGADLSQFCVITDTVRKLKATLIGRALVPNISITDPRLLVTMPEDLNAATGLDALTHGIEAYVSRAASPLTDVHALTAIRLVSGNLLRTIDTPLDTGARAGMAQARLEAGLEPVLWHAVTPNPKDHEVRAAFRDYVDSGADVVVGIGGGSVIDAAKGVAILQGNGGDILDYAGVDQATRPIPPLVMIPSTSGTGADVSQFCIVTDTARSVKITIMGRALVPDISITDARLLVTMPEDLNAATGLDALTHGVEAYVSLAHNPLADGHALNAVGLVCRHLRSTMTHPRSEPARAKMAQASLEAGLAFTNAILGATHAMSHQVGGLLDAPHGVVNGVLLPHVMRFNAGTHPEPFVPIAQALGLAVESMSPEDAAHAAADHVRELANSVGVPKGLGDLGVTEEDIAQLSINTLGDACLTTNPRDASVDDVTAIFRAAL